VLSVAKPPLTGRFAREATEKSTYGDAPMPTPIAVFAFDRPEHLRQTLAALAANDLAPESSLTVFCDGPRRNSEEDLVFETRAVAASTRGFASVRIVEREQNLGLAGNIMLGVDEMLSRNDTVVVLEDDLLTSPYFLRYINDGLGCYADNERVASVHGYCFPHARGPEHDTFFLKGADCWGWGTWKRAWRYFNPDALALLDALRRRGEMRAFNRGLTYDYTGMLEDAASGKVSSWAVRWLASAWLEDMYTLYPGRSLVFHNGSDGSGTHCANDRLHDVPLADRPVAVYPIAVREDATMARELCNFLRTLSGGPWCLRTRKLKQFLQRKFPTAYSFVRSVKKGIDTLKEIREVFSKNCSLMAVHRELKPSSLNERMFQGYKFVKTTMREIMPPFLWRFAKRLCSDVDSSSLNWQGNYPDWQSAVAASGGYGEEAVFLKMRDAARVVRDGSALWERDSVLFYHEEYNYPLVAALMSVAAWNKGELSVLDFGGAFGSTYRQNRRIFKNLNVSWAIVEQPHIVECGRKEFSDGTLAFFSSIQEAYADSPADVVVFSSSLQYIESPYDLLEKITSLNPKAIIIDRTPLAEKGERITVQHVPPEIYSASYPCRWLDKRRVNGILERTMRLSPWWQSAVDPPGFHGVFAYQERITA
jgi:putative methyltransferase (TIGR04325 family)